MSRSLSFSLPLGDKCGGSLRDEGLSLSGCIRETPDDVEGPGTGESSRGEADAARVAVAVGGPRDLVMVSSPLEALSLARERARERGRLAEFSLEASAAGTAYLLMLLSTLLAELDAAAAAQLEAVPAAAAAAALEPLPKLGPLPR